MHPYFYIKPPKWNFYHYFYFTGFLIWAYIAINYPVEAFGLIFAFVTFTLCIYFVYKAIFDINPDHYEPQFDNTPVIVPLEVTKPRRTEPTTDVKRRYARIKKRQKQTFDPSELEINF